MSKPPKDVEPSELFKKLLEARPSEVKDVPTVGEIRIRVLKGDELDQARKIAIRRMKDDGFSDAEFSNEAVQELLGDAQARETLALACQTVKNLNKDPDPDATPKYGFLFRSGDDVKKALSGPQLGKLWLAYRETEHRFGPTEDTAWDEESVTAWVKALVEGGRSHPLLRMSWPALAEFTVWLARRVYILSSLLDSLSKELPPFLESNPGVSSLGIGSVGWQPVSFSGGNLLIRRDEAQAELEPPPLTDGDGEPITAEQAERIIAKLNQ